MRNLYAPNQEYDEMPYLKLALDYVIEDPPSNPRGQSIVDFIQTNIYNPALDRQDSISLLPEEWEDWILPHPVYK